jgi:hypothetical protein
MAALAAFFASWSGAMAGVALDPYDSPWHVYAVVSGMTAILGGISIALARCCRCRRAVTGLAVFCVGTWIVSALCERLVEAFDSSAAAPRLLLVASGVGAAMLLVVLALPTVLDSDGR